ncbi:MAG: dihydrofolate reductase family protein [Synoicihabitans sp.]
MLVVLIVAQSLDGFIARHDEPGVAWASSADQRWFRQALGEFDCQVMASTTYQTVRDHLRSKSEDGCFRIVMTRRPQNFAADQETGALEFTSASPAAILRTLTDSDRTACALLGGATAHDAFLRSGLVNEIWVTIEPRIFGRGTPLVRETQDQKLAIISSERLPNSDSLLVRYRVIK